MPLSYERNTTSPRHIPPTNNTLTNNTLGRSSLTLEIKASATGFYASIYSKQQLISQTQIFKSSSKATQEGYRHIDSLLQESSRVSHAFFN